MCCMSEYSALLVHVLSVARFFFMSIFLNFQDRSFTLHRKCYKEALGTRSAHPYFRLKIRESVLRPLSA
jgi:hypothetical protein